MSEENLAVETNTQQAAVGDGVEVQASIAPEMHEDYLAVIEAKDAELAKIRQEKENYKRGLLKAKGKIEDDVDIDEDLDAKVDRLIAEKLLASKEAQVLKEKDEALQKVLKRNKELELALKNRSQIAPSGMGGHTEAQPVSDHIISVDQEKTLRAKGWDDAKILRFKQNLLKQKQ